MLDAVINLLAPMPEIGLDEMEQVRLMNRIDKKYLVTESQLIAMLERLQGNYMAQVVDGVKYLAYRTVYLDDRNHTMYLAHHNGHLTRQKVRVRTYLDSIKPSFFEVKLKNNHGRTKKKRMRINSLDTMLADGAGEFLAEKALLPIPLADMIPTVENSFERITLVNMAKTERLTIDVGLTFHNLETGQTRKMDNLVVVEVKRNGRVDSPVVGVLRDLRVHPSGFSKYCIGSALTNPSLKRNRFNIRIRKVNKLTTI